jgi:hypothetical protein
MTVDVEWHVEVVFVFVVCSRGFCGAEGLEAFKRRVGPD